MDPRESLDYYRTESAQEPQGPPRRRSAMGLSSHVPVRFTPETVGAVRHLARREGLTVSTWIRRTVERELERLTPPQTQGQSPNKLTVAGAHTESESQGLEQGDFELQTTRF